MDKRACDKKLSIASFDSEMNKNTQSEECRACLQVIGNQTAYNLFESWVTPWAVRGAIIADDLSKFADVEIMETDKYSKVICSKCYSRLSDACTFMITVQMSDTILRQRADSTDSNNEPGTSWPQPILLNKSGDIAMDNNMVVEVKQEILSDDNVDQNEPDMDGDWEPTMDIKIEPEEISAPVQLNAHVNGSSHKFVFKRLHLFEIWVSKTGTNADKTRQVYQELVESLPDVKYINTDILYKRVQYICKKIAEFWKKQHGRAKVKRVYEDWLNVMEKCFPDNTHEETANLVITNSSSDQHHHDLEKAVKQEPQSADELLEELPELPLNCLLCCKVFSTISGLKAHVISQHSYKTVKRRAAASPPPARSKVRRGFPASSERACGTLRLRARRSPRRRDHPGSSQKPQQLTQPVNNTTKLQIAGTEEITPKLSQPVKSTANAQKQTTRTEKAKVKFDSPAREASVIATEPESLATKAPAAIEPKAPSVKPVVKIESESPLIEDMETTESESPLIAAESEKSAIDAIITVKSENSTVRAKVVMKAENLTREPVLETKSTNPAIVDIISHKCDSPAIEDMIAEKVQELVRAWPSTEETDMDIVISQAQSEIKLENQAQTSSVDEQKIVDVIKDNTVENDLESRLSAMFNGPCLISKQDASKIELKTIDMAEELDQVPPKFLPSKVETKESGTKAVVSNLKETQILESESTKEEIQIQLPNDEMEIDSIKEIQRSSISESTTDSTVKNLQPDLTKIPKRLDSVVNLPLQKMSPEDSMSNSLQSLHSDGPSLSETLSEIQHENDLQPEIVSSLQHQDNFEEILSINLGESLKEIKTESHNLPTGEEIEMYIEQTTDLENSTQSNNIDNNDVPESKTVDEISEMKVHLAINPLNKDAVLFEAETQSIDYEESENCEPKLVSVISEQSDITRT